MNFARVRLSLGGGLGDRPISVWRRLFENQCANSNLTLNGLARPTGILATPHGSSGSTVLLGSSLAGHEPRAEVSLWY